VPRLGASTISAEQTRVASSSSHSVPLLSSHPAPDLPARPPSYSQSLSLSPPTLLDDLIDDIQ
jgi:hypothetical protein